MRAAVGGLQRGFTPVSTTPEPEVFPGVSRCSPVFPGVPRCSPGVPPVFSAAAASIARPPGARVGGWRKIAGETLQLPRVAPMLQAFAVGGVAIALGGEGGGWGWLVRRGVWSNR